MPPASAPTQRSLRWSVKSVVLSGAATGRRSDLAGRYFAIVRSGPAASEFRSPAPEWADTAIRRKKAPRIKGFCRLFIDKTPLALIFRPSDRDLLQAHPDTGLFASQ